MTIHEASRYLTEQLSTIYSKGEAGAITTLVIEHLTGDRNEPSYQKQKNISDDQRTRMDAILKRLLTYEPIQYVLNETWFCGLKFYVDKNVLIPRPETEELVEWIISNCRFPVDELSILDIGSGSGCIPVALKRRLRKASVWSCDISDQALDIAKKNALNLGVEINFLQLDFLSAEQRNELPPFDIIVSNPPYVPLKDKEQMNTNVLDYEPATALFVPDNDPLVFYRVIAGFGKEKLNRNGAIYAEIHESLGEAAMQLFQSHGYITELKKDMQGKDRMIKVTA